MDFLRLTLCGRGFLGFVPLAGWRHPGKSGPSAHPLPPKVEAARMGYGLSLKSSADLSDSQFFD